MNLTGYLFADIPRTEASGVIDSQISVITFLIGTASFVMGLYILQPLPKKMGNRLIVLTLVLILPAAAVDIYFGLLMIAFSLYSSYIPILSCVTTVIVVLLILVIKSLPVKVSEIPGGLK